MKLLEYAKYLVRTHNGDTKFVKKMVSNAARIALEEGDTEDFYTQSETLQYVEFLEENKHPN